jgi:glycosyltransferase involved in cell wall biosynthesis
MIIIATDIIGGPGKGLFQFLKFADHDRFDYILCNYDRADLSGLREDFVAKAGTEGITVHCFYQRAAIDPLVVLAALKMIRRHRIDIVQTHGYKSNVLGCALKFFSGTSWIAFSHGYTTESRKIIYYNRLDQLCYRFSDLAVVVSEPLKQLLLAKGVRAEKIVKLPNAVDVLEVARQVEPESLRRSLALPPDGPVIAVVGRLSAEKGQMVFLQALRRIKDAHAGLKALIIGDGPEKATLLAYCRANGLLDSVIFTGHVHNVGDYYRIMDLLVIPSFSEGLPNVLLEAMAIGLPVVATEVGAIGEVLDGMPASMVPAGDPAALGARISRYLREPELVRHAVLQAKAVVQSRYHPAARAGRIVDLYDHVIKR